MMISQFFLFDIWYLTDFYHIVRLHAQALTLAALAGAAAVEYYDHKSGATDRIPKFLKPDNLNKD